MEPKKTAEVVVARELNVGPRTPIDEPTQILLDPGSCLIEIGDRNDVRVPVTRAPAGAKKWPNIRHLRTGLEDDAPVAAAGQIARERSERLQIASRLLGRVLRLMTA